MTSAPPPDLVAELGSLAAGLGEADAWVLFATAAGELSGKKVAGAFRRGFPIHLLRKWLTQQWAEVMNATAYVGPGPPELQAPPWNLRTVAVLPLRRTAKEVVGALCLLNANEGHCRNGEQRTLQFVADRLARVIPSPQPLTPVRTRTSGPKRTAELEALLQGLHEEDPQHWQAEKDACEHYARMERFEGAMLGLVKAGHDDLPTTLGLITEVAAGALEVERADIWLFDDAHACLRRWHTFPAIAVGEELILCTADCPHFFAGLDAQLAMAIPDAAEDLRGQELIARLHHSGDGGTPPVGAMLIVPIWLEGRAAGVLAHFHCGTAREWSRDEQDFAGAVAGIIAVALEADAHRRTEVQLHALAAHLDSVREEERAALARELHDELGQMLTALRMDAAWLGKACTTQPEKLAARGPERVKAMKQLLDEAVATVQRISSDLRPGPLHELGLVAALEWQLGEFEKRSGIRATFAGPEGELAIAERASVALYRALQEALTNVARHSGATEVRTTLRVSSQRISLEIRDNGIGISANASRNATSLGLIGMRERAAALGGEVLFRGAAGQGTAVLVSLPNPAALSSSESST